MMRRIVKAILHELENKAIEEYKVREPDRYYKHGRQPRARKFITSFGPIHYKMAQIYYRENGKVFCPLVKKLEILPYKQYQRHSLEAVVGPSDSSFLSNGKQGGLQDQRICAE